MSGQRIRWVLLFSIYQWILFIAALEHVDIPIYVGSARIVDESNRFCIFDSWLPVLVGQSERAMEF